MVDRQSVWTIIAILIILSLSGLIIVDKIEIDMYKIRTSLQKTELDINNHSIIKLNDVINIRNEQLDKYKNYTDILMNKSIKLENQIIDYKEIIIYKDLKYNQKQGIIMKPTYRQVLDFLESDTISDKEWTYKYDCTQFAHDTIKNALAVGIFGCVVNMDYERKFQGHDIIAFDTLEFGVLYFEPSTDDNVYMYAGMDYSGYLGYEDEISLIVRQYDSCFERVN